MSDCLPIHKIFSSRTQQLDAAALAVARAGLRPVDKLTEAVEHVARTEDLGIRIPVDEDSEDEVARLSRSFNSMTSALANSRELQQQLIADAGHELRTPLTSLRTNIELLTRSEETGRPIPEADRKALLASVKAQMTELAALIGDLQTLSRSDAGTPADRVQVVSLQDTVEAALRRARLRGPELTITANVDPWFVRAEPSALERAIVNILDNAVKFSPEGGTVDVTLKDDELTVQDSLAPPHPAGGGIGGQCFPARGFSRSWSNAGGFSDDMSAGTVSTRATGHRELHDPGSPRLSRSDSAAESANRQRAERHASTPEP